MATQNYFKAKNGLEAPSQSTIAVTDSNFPTVRPTLNLDFAGSESVDSRITFTRASAATYTGADGKLKYATQNEPRIDYDPVTGECKGLLIEEQRTNICVFDSAININWALNACTSKPNVAIAPDGSMSADQLVTLPASSGSNNAYTYPGSGTMTNGTVYTYSVYAKSAGVSYIFLQGVQAGGFAKAYFNLSTGTLGTVPAQYVASMKPCGNGWYRCSITFTCDYISSSVLALGMSAADNSIGIVGDASSGVYIWGAQVEAGAFPTSYIPTTPTFTSRASSATYFDSTGTLRIAGTNQARYGYGYDSTSGKWISQGLILETAATNLVTNSEHTSGVSYSTDGTTTVYSSVEATPYGVNGVWGYTANQGYCYRTIQTLSATDYTCLSMFLKQGPNATTASIAIYYVSAYAGPYATLDFTTGAVTVTGSYVRAAGSQYMGNGIWRVWVSSLPYGSSTIQTFNVPANGTKFWGVQLENNTAYPTSYIPTFSSTATRAADVSSSAATTRSADNATMQISNIPQISSSGGSFYVDAYRNSTASELIGIGSDTFSNSWRFGTGAEAIRGYTAGNFEIGLTNNYSAPIGKVKIAAYVSNNNSYGYFNGLNLGIDTSCVFPQFTTLRLGTGYLSQGGSSTISKIVYWPQALSANQLSALTA